MENILFSKMLYAFLQYINKDIFMFFYVPDHYDYRIHIVSAQWKVVNDYLPWTTKTTLMSKKSYLFITLKKDLVTLQS